MMKKVLASVAAAGLVVAPIAAQANTRAGESRVSLAALKGAGRLASPIGLARQQGEDGEMPIWLLVLLFGAAGAGIIAAVEATQSGRSPGT